MTIKSWGAMAYCGLIVMPIDNMGGDVSINFTVIETNPDVWVATADIHGGDISDVESGELCDAINHECLANHKAQVSTIHYTGEY